MSPQEISDILDREFSVIIQKLAKNSGMDSTTYSGTVAGFLIKTGIYLAARDGCPNKVLRDQLAVIIKEAYAKKGIL